MNATGKQTIVELVEEFRSTGYSGRDPSYASVPKPMGTCATALRQLEVMATHVASAWLDGDMNENQFWPFAKDCLLTDILSLASIVEETFHSTPRLSFSAAWRGVERLIEEFSIARPDRRNTCEIVVSFLVATMALRQMAEDEIAPGGRDGLFRSSSSNVAPQFFERCIDALSWRPFGANAGMPLSDVGKQLESLMPSEAVHQRIA